MTSLLSVFCYDRTVYKLDPSPDLAAYVEQIDSVSHIIKQLDLRGISLIGVLNEENEYSIIGFMKSPISSRYKMQPLIYDAKDHTGKGLLCMLTPGIFASEFDLYEATNDNIDKLHMYYPYYFIYLSIANGEFHLEASYEDIRNTSWSVLKTQLTPYMLICILLLIFWLIMYKVMARKLLVTRNDMRGRWVGPAER